MAEALNKATIAFSTTLKLNEVEIQALEALVCYGDEAFLRVFKANLGTAYIKDHEDGIRSLFRAINRDVVPAHRRIVEARNDLIAAERRRAEEAVAKRAAGLNLEPIVSTSGNENETTSDSGFHRIRNILLGLGYRT